MEEGGHRILDEMRWRSTTTFLLCRELLDPRFHQLEELRDFLSPLILLKQMKPKKEESLVDSFDRGLTAQESQTHTSRSLGQINLIHWRILS